LGELTALPDPLAGFKGPTSMRREGGDGRGGQGRQGKGAGRERRREGREREKGR